MEMKFVLFPFLLFFAGVWGADYGVNELRDQNGILAGSVFVTIPNGTVRGYSSRADNNNTFYAFKNIPFAKPPTGELRFKNPEPPVPWEGVLDNTGWSPACPQLFSFIPSKEDCLYLNVYTPRLGNAKPLAPVMVWLFGGGFTLGENAYYTGNRLLSKDIVMVVPQYRVNVFGFLSTNDSHSSGNYGLKDQCQAIKWVSENIEHFGGDPNRVTIFGESAGAASVSFQILSKACRDKFHAAIAQSGAPLTPWTIDRDPMKQAVRMAKSLECPEPHTSENIVACLMKQREENITGAHLIHLINDLTTMSMKLLGTTPTIEPDLPGAFLTQDPLDILRAGDLPDIPVLYGANNEDGAFVIGGFHFLNFGRPDRVPHTVKNQTWLREDMMNELMRSFDVSTQGPAVPLEEIMALAYFPGKNRINFDEVTNGLTDMFSAFAFKAPIKKTCDMISDVNDKVYLYSYEYSSKNCRNSLWYYVFKLFAVLMGGTEPPFKHGTIHADDLLFLFNMPSDFDERDSKFSAMMVDLWTNFATHGNPTPAATEDYPEWTPYTRKEPFYMRLDEKATLEKDYTKQWVKP